MATHGWTNEAASQLYYPRGDITYGTTPPTRTYTTPTSLTTSRNASIVQDTSDFAADLVHESVVAFEPRHPSIYYSSHVAIDGSTGIWSETGAYPASPDVLAQTEALSDVAPKYADWLAFGGDIARAQEGVTLLNAYEPMCCFGQASGGVSAVGSTLPVPRPVVASEKILCASASRRFRQPKYRCRHCPSEFTTKQNCIRHINAHWGLKQFRCTCGKRFTTKSDMTRHQRKSHYVSGAGCLMDLARV
ncbi:hypothetical protein PLEOSDRAFT_1101103 [Pleurotus ostreatus PC15]|uniref:C2H2-type domain-containing protein n=1 Tax=Pleurotus ostreatus (strain PC15) TaxID=1137138 RepID=A0A067NQ74_PLEO1|nr:hypothetical protein PLEOSDRAFT_1101103 [Pleurotus ostreatus PC15]